MRVDKPEAVGPAWDEAFAAGRPALVEFVTDPDVPPVPPHVTGKQMKGYASAVLKRDPDAIAMLIATAKEWWDGMFPPRDGKR